MYIAHCTIVHSCRRWDVWLAVKQDCPINGLLNSDSPVRHNSVSIANCTLHLFDCGDLSNLVQLWYRLLTMVLFSWFNLVLLTDAWYDAVKLSNVCFMCV